MEVAVTFIGLPVATYLALASLRRGRPAVIGVLGAAVITGLLFVTQAAAEGGYSTAISMLVFSAIALAALVQVLRMMIGLGRPSWVYPVMVALALVVAGIPMLKILAV